jgi:tetratricopeptide (TPR) repeat protein
MNCDQVEREEIIEKYLTGRLEGAEKNEFEDHWLGCPECREKLEFSRMLQEKLWEKGDKLVPRAQEPARVPVRRRAWVYSAAAAALIIAAAAVVWWQVGEHGRPQAGTTGIPSSLLMLAAIKPPLYIPPALRGAQDEAAERFRLGMALYQEGRYDAAIPDLLAAADLNPKGAGIRFFLGICLLLTGQTDSGIGELQAAISLGESVYLEEAHFYLAKAFLGKGDVGGAKEEFNRVLERGGALKDEASRILAQIQ